MEKPQSPETPSAPRVICLQKVWALFFWFPYGVWRTRILRFVPEDASHFGYPILRDSSSDLERARGKKKGHGSHNRYLDSTNVPVLRARNLRLIKLAHYASNDQI